MAINDFLELKGLHGTLAEAATTSLTRYFAILRKVKPSIRAQLNSEDLKELTEVVTRLYPTRSLGSDCNAITEQIASHVSSECATKLLALSEVERVAFVDAVERTVNISSKLRRFAEESRFIL